MNGSLHFWLRSLLVLLSSLSLLSTILSSTGGTTKGARIRAVGKLISPAVIFVLVGFCAGCAFMDFQAERDAAAFKYVGSIENVR